MACYKVGLANTDVVVPDFHSQPSAYTRSQRIAARYNGTLRTPSLLCLCQGTPTEASHA